MQLQTLIAFLFALAAGVNGAPAARDTRETFRPETLRRDTRFSTSQWRSVKSEELHRRLRRKIFKNYSKNLPTVAPKVHYKTVGNLAHGFRVVEDRQI